MLWGYWLDRVKSTRKVPKKNLSSQLSNKVKSEQRKSESVKGSIREPKVVSDMNKAEIAFTLFDGNRDGYVTSAEMMKKSRTLTKEQIDKVCFSYSLFCL